MRGAGLVVVLCWLIFLAILFAYTVGVELAETVERLAP